MIQNIGNFAKHKSDGCVLGVNYVISEHNYRRIYKAVCLLKELGADNIMFAAVIENVKNYHQAIKDEAIEQIHCAKRELESNSFQIINNYENGWIDKDFSTQSFLTCYVCRLVTEIAADQKVYLCHTRAYDSKPVVADIKDKSFREAWYSKTTRSRLLKIDPCQGYKNFCVYEERNKMIKAYLDVNYDHINFIRGRPTMKSQP